MPSSTSEGEQRRFRCLRWRTKLLIFHGGFSACSGRPALKCRADNSSQQPPGAVGSRLHGDAGSGRRCTTARGAASSCIGRHGRAVLPWWCPGTARVPVCGDRVGAAVPAARWGLARGRRGCGRACREPVGGFLILKGVLTSLSAPNCPHVAFPTD